MSHEHYVESLLKDSQDEAEAFPQHHYQQQQQQQQQQQPFPVFSANAMSIPESVMQKFKAEAQFRSNSAPPSTRDVDSTTPISEEDQYRSDPDYYSYYYSTRLLNPRLPPPMAPSDSSRGTWVRSQHQHQQHQQQQHQSNVPSRPPPIVTNVSGGYGEAAKNITGPALSAVKRSSAVDRIQEDFPRTPSPVLVTYPKSPQHPASHPAAVTQQPKSILQRPHPVNRSNNASVGFFNGTASNEEEAVLINRMQNMSIANERKIQQPQELAEQRQIQQQQQHQQPRQHQQHQQEYYQYQVDEHGETSEYGYENGYPPSHQQQRQHHPSQHSAMMMPMNAYTSSPYGYTTGGGYPGPAHPIYPPPEYMQRTSQHQGPMPMHDQRKVMGSYPPMAHHMVARPPYHPDEFYRGQPGWPAPPMYTGAPMAPIPHRHPSQPRLPGQKNYASRGGSSSSRGGRSMGAQSRPYRSSPARVTPQSDKMIEFKSGQTFRSLLDIKNHVNEFSRDQHGSRFIQQTLESAVPKEKEMAFQEILPEALELTTDVFGNYVIQKFFEYGTRAQRKKLCEKLKGSIAELALQTYGCRVIQKALEFVDNEQRALICKELEGYVTACLEDQNGNHVIQKCIEMVPSEMAQFIVEAFRGNVHRHATHPYGCRVIQRILEHCGEKQTKPIFDEIIQSVLALAQDPYGNYVVQHVLEKGHLKQKSTMIRCLRGSVELLSQNKFASNVVEKCFQNGSKKERNDMIQEIVSRTSRAHDFAGSPLFHMIQDQYANYVVQRVIELADDAQRRMIFNVMRPHMPLIRKSTYGRHILSVVEKYPLATGPQ